MHLLPIYRFILPITLWSWRLGCFCYLVFMGIHLKGAGEALCLELPPLLVLHWSYLSLRTFWQCAFVWYSSHRSCRYFLPFGYMGIWAAVPYAISLQLKGCHLQPKKQKIQYATRLDWFNVDIGIVCTFILGAGAAGSNALKNSGAPMHSLRYMVSTHGWQALLTSCGSYRKFLLNYLCIFTLALSRAGYLPKNLSLTNECHIGPLSFLALLASYSL